MLFTDRVLGRWVEAFAFVDDDELHETAAARCSEHGHLPAGKHALPGLV